MKKTKKAIILTVLILTALIVAFFCILSAMSPKILNHSAAKIKTLTTLAVNKSVMNTLQNFGYGDFVTIEKDNQGKITGITANSMLLNSLARLLVFDVEKNIEGITKDGIDIPLGNLSNWAIFVGKGPKVNIGVRPFEEVTCKFTSEFESAGINQTRHKIYLQVVTSFNVLVPTASTVVTNTTEVLIAETIIVGEVPHFYFDFGQNSYTPNG